MRTRHQEFALGAAGGVVREVGVEQAYRPASSSGDPEGMLEF